MGIILAVLSVGGVALTLFRRRIIQPPEVIGTFISEECLINIQRALGRTGGWGQDAL